MVEQPAGLDEPLEPAMAAIRDSIVGDFGPLVQRGEVCAIYTARDGQHARFTMSELPEGVRDIHPTQMLGALVDFELGRGAPTFMVMAADSYEFVRSSDPDEPQIETMPRGTLAELFARGDPHVTECVHLTYQDVTGASWFALRPYTRTKTSMVWGDLVSRQTTDDMTFTGDVPNHLRRLYGLPPVYPDAVR